VTTDLNTLLTALYVKIDDEIGGTRCLGRPPLLSDSELVCLAVAQALLGYHSEGRWLRHANKHLTGTSRTCPITDKGFSSRPFEKDLVTLGIELLRPSLKRENKHYGEPMLKKVRQLIESVNDTLKGQHDLERHGGRTFEGVAVRVTQRVLAMAAGIWHNNLTGATVTRSLIAYDH
jgi:hypothetical protein